MPSCPVKTKDWSWADSTYFWILGLGVSERAKVPLHERLNDLSAVKTRFKNSSVPLQQYRIHQRRIINLQNIIQSPPKPLNCMLQLIEVLIQLLELLGNFLLNRSLDGEKSKAQQKWIIHIISWLCNDTEKNLTLLLSCMCACTHRHTPTYLDTRHWLSPGLITSVLDLKATLFMAKNMTFEFRQASIPVLILLPSSHITAVIIFNFSTIPYD